MSKIKRIEAKQILNSKHEPTVEAELQTADGVFLASVPSGTSKGEHEAVEVPVEQAIKNIAEKISPALQGKDVSDQKKIDDILIELDSTDDKSHLGVNALLAVSIACCRAGAAAKNVPLYQHISAMAGTGPMSALPRPCFNVLEGGKHAQNNLDIQEFMIVPKRDSFKENLEAGLEIFKTLGKVIEEKFNGQAEKGQEAGFAPAVDKPQQALDLISSAIERAGYKGKVEIGLDCAASEFSYQGKELLKLYQEIVGEYPILFLEDPFSQEDWQSWKEIKQEMADKVLIIGDDLTVTNPQRIKKAQEEQACNGIILKPNQIGTISEVIEAAKLAKKFNWQAIVSHRAGETNDDFIADLAVGLGAGFIKSGAPGAKERMAKYNRLLKICLK